MVPYLIMGESIWRNQYHKKDRFYNILIKTTIIQNFRIYCQLADMISEISDPLYVSKYVQGPNHFNENEFFATNTWKDMSWRQRVCRLCHILYSIWYGPYEMIYSLYQYSAVLFESVSKWVTMVNRIKSILRSHTQYVQLTLCHVRYYILYDLNLYIVNIVWFLSDSNFILYVMHCSIPLYDYQA